MNQLIKYFLRGLLIVVPIAASIYIVYALIAAADSLLQVPESWGIASVPGVGVLLTLLGIVLIGWLGSNFVARWIFGLVETTFSRLPLVKLLYTSIRDLIGAFVGDARKFDRPVAVSLSPAGTTKVLGFITRDDVAMLGVPGHLAVYLPHTYSFSGNLVLVPREQVMTLETNPSDLMAFIVSGGVSAGTTEPSPAAPSVAGG